MEREPLNHFIYVNLSAADRRTLERIAEERGATLSGVVRKLIRDAQQRPTIARADDREVRYASGR